MINLKRVVMTEVNLVRKAKKNCVFLALEKSFQLEYVDGEPLFVCNVCDKGLDSEAEV